MATAKSGDNVHIHYRGTLADGSQFDSSEGREPLQFTLGSGQVIPGFDSAVEGMAPGEKKTVNIPAEQAYGQRQDGAVMQYPLTDFPPDISPAVGLELHLSDDEGHIIPVTITEVTDTTVTLDANHALAGKDLTFDLELVRIG
jgi:FKBP-type peptidyl-prolyl cis-trans isomerase 2